MKLHKTKNDLAEKTRRKMIDLLNQNLADALDLHLQGKQAHWNVKGPSFSALHELFDKVEEKVEEFADDIAERAVALGGVALGTARVAAKHSRTREYPLDISNGREHVEALAGALAAFGSPLAPRLTRRRKQATPARPICSPKFLAAPTSLLWFVEAHAQAKE